MCFFWVNWHFVLLLWHVPKNILLLSTFLYDCLYASLPSRVPSLLLTLLFCLHSHCIHQILDCVSYTHQHEIVHRDLKVCVCLIVLHCPAPSAQGLLFVTCLCLIACEFKTMCLCLLSVCPSLFVCLPVFRFCFWDSCCTILDGLY